jgi:hypothetical protein
MAELSRVKKNQSLRLEIENDREEALVSPALSAYAERLNKINPTLSMINESESLKDYEPLHVRRQNSLSSTEISNPNQQHEDLMLDFLSEVKQYNVDKGYRSAEDTSKDILKQLEPETIAQDSLDFDLEKDKETIRRMIESDYSIDDDASTEFSEESQTDLKLVVEETQKIKVQLNEYEKGLVDMNESVLSSNRLLNILIFILVLILMVMLGVAIYWVLYSKGLY